MRRMKGERWRQIETLFHAACESEPGDQAAFLAEACAGDEDLHREIASLLAEHAREGSVLEKAVSDLAVEWAGNTMRMLQSGATLGKYRIERELGQGGMGVVFLAYDATLQRRLAIKVLRSAAEDESSHGLLVREARSASALNHPNICTIYEVGETDQWAFIAMEYIEGRALCDVIDAGALPVADAVHYAIETSDALAHAHDRGVVHRDLKAANAIVSSNGRLKIVDFGLARRIDTGLDATIQMTHG